MPFYRKKPVIVEAQQFDGTRDEAHRLRRWIGPYATTYKTDEGWVITFQSREGILRIDQRDWIIKLDEGKFIPCRPDIFAATYESAEEPRHD